MRKTLDGVARSPVPGIHTPVVMAMRGPKAQALAADLADTVTFALALGESRPEVALLARDFRAIRDIELALHVSVVGDNFAPFLAPPTLILVRFAQTLTDRPDVLGSLTAANREHNWFHDRPILSAARSIRRRVVRLHSMKARHPNLLDYPGRFVAIDEATDRVVADAATLVDLWELIRDRDLKVSIMRAPREDEPVLVGLG